MLTFAAMTEKNRAYLTLHFCVVIWGFTAVLGGLISLKTNALVWWRVALCCAVLPFLIPRQYWSVLDRRLFWRLFGIGILVGIHWLCFYGAIKLANASVSVITMATTSFFAAVIEPLLRRSRFDWLELGLGMLILPGMALVVGSLDFSMWLGFAVGLVGAFLAALFSILNKITLEKHAPPAILISFVELFAVTVLCSVLLPIDRFFNSGERFLPLGNDWIWLPILAWACTILPFFLSLQAMRHLSAFSINLALNLEPVYGIVLAGLILHEHKSLNPGFYVGVLIILAAVFSHPFLKKMKTRRA